MLIANCDALDYYYIRIIWTQVPAHHHIYIILYHSFEEKEKCMHSMNWIKCYFDNLLLVADQTLLKQF